MPKGDICDVIVMIFLVTKGTCPRVIIIESPCTYERKKDKEINEVASRLSNEGRPPEGGPRRPLISPAARARALRHFADKHTERLKRL